MNYFVFTLAAAPSGSSRSSIVTCMSLTLLPGYRVVLLSQRQVPWWGSGQNLGINFMKSMHCWHGCVMHAHIYIWSSCKL